VENVEDVDLLVIEAVDGNVSVAFGLAADDNVRKLRAGFDHFSPPMNFAQSFDLVFKKIDVAGRVTTVVVLLVPIPDNIKLLKRDGA
jgi:hypothetical protein